MADMSPSACKVVRSALQGINDGVATISDLNRCYNA